jgi:hypothetical protein
MFAGTPVVVNPDADGRYFYHQFETGTHDWTGRGEAAVARSAAQKYAGSSSLAVTGRAADWNGAAYSLSTNPFAPGGEFSFSVMAMHNGTTAADTAFKLTLQYDTDSTRYSQVALLRAASGQWVKLANTRYTIPSGASNLILYVEMPGSTADFYIDEAMGAVAGTTGPGNTTSVLGGKIAVRGQSPSITVRERTLAVNAPEGSSVKVRVVNLNGKTVAAFNSTGSANFSLRKVPAGAYIVEAARGGHIATSAIMLR